MSNQNKNFLSFFHWKSKRFEKRKRNVIINCAKPLLCTKPITFSWPKLLEGKKCLIFEGNHWFFFSVKSLISPISSWQDQGKTFHFVNGRLLNLPFKQLAGFIFTMTRRNYHPKKSSQHFFFEQAAKTFFFSWNQSETHLWTNWADFFSPGNGFWVHKDTWSIWGIFCTIIFGRHVYLKKKMKTKLVDLKSLIKRGNFW